MVAVLMTVRLGLALARPWVERQAANLSIIPENGLPNFRIVNASILVPRIGPRLERP